MNRLQSLLWKACSDSDSLCAGQHCLYNQVHGPHFPAKGTESQYSSVKIQAGDLLLQICKAALLQGLYEQFRRIANFYFLLIAIISLTPVRWAACTWPAYSCRVLCSAHTCWSGCSPVSPITNVLPLVLVLGVSLAKEAYEDRKRAIKDQEVSP